MAEITRRTADELARDAARLFEAATHCFALANEAAVVFGHDIVNRTSDAAEVAQAIAGEQLHRALAEAGAISRARAESVAAGWWINGAGRVVPLRARKGGK